MKSKIIDFYRFFKPVMAKLNFQQPTPVFVIISFKNIYADMVLIFSLYEKQTIYMNIFLLFVFTMIV